MSKRKDRNGRLLPDNVSQRADGRYIYRYTLHGKTKYLYDRDLNKLKEKISKLQLDIASGKDIDLGSLSLNQWFPQYLEIFKLGRIKDMSYTNMQNYYNWYMKDSLIAELPIASLKRVQLIKHFQDLADKKGLSEGTLKSLASMLYNCLQQALYDGAIFVNPASEIIKEVRARPKEVREALSEEEVAVLMDFLKEEGFQQTYLPMIGIMLGTGVRYGELVGLTWRDVDFDRKVIHVNKTLNYKDRGNGHEFFITTPKTKNAYRDIPMSEDVITLFKIQKNYQKKLRIRQDITIDGYKEFIFTTKLGWPISHEGFTSSLRRIIKYANQREAEIAEKENRTPVVVSLKVTPHYFRHTFCTRLVENEVPYESLKVLMGHSSIKTTIDIYASIKNGNYKRARHDIENIRIF